MGNALFYRWEATEAELELYTVDFKALKIKVRRTAHQYESYPRAA